MSGTIRSAVSRVSSAAKPPIPNSTSDPNSGSRVTPTIDLDARRHHRLHDHAAHGVAERRRASAPNAARTASAEPRPRRTPPTSVLWTTAAEPTLQHDGVADRARPRRRPRRRRRPTRWPRRECRSTRAAPAPRGGVAPHAVARVAASSRATSACARRVVDAGEHRHRPGRAGRATRRGVRHGRARRRRPREREGRDRAAVARRRLELDGAVGAEEARDDRLRHLATGRVAARIASATSSASGDERRHEDHDHRVDLVVVEEHAERRARRSPHRRRATRSTGLRRPASGDVRAASAALGLGRRARGPRGHGATHASAARIPGPPPLLTIATRRPRGSGWCASRIAVSKSSSSVSTRITPAWRNSASTATSGAASAAVCDAGAARAGRRASALHRHDRLRPRDAAREARELARVPERLEVQQDHVGVGIVLPVLEEVVAAHVGLVAHRHERRDAEARVTRRGRAARCRARPTATRTRRARRAAGTARRSRSCGCRRSVLTTPMQFGPTTRMPLRRASSTSSRSRAPALDLREAGRDHDEAAHARRGAFLDDVEHRGRRRDDHGEVDRGRGCRARDA